MTTYDKRERVHARTRHEYTQSKPGDHSIAYAITASAAETQTLSLHALPDHPNNLSKHDTRNDNEDNEEDYKQQKVSEERRTRMVRIGTFPYL